MSINPIFSPKDLAQNEVNVFFERFKYEEIEKINTIINNWSESALKLKLQTTNEIGLQSDFINDIFSEILGYKKLIGNIDKWNIEKEQNTLDDSTRPDGKLGYFYMENGLKKSDVRVVVELKKFDVDLDIKQSRIEKITPIEQAFRYVPKCGELCNWVIVSNFNEIRLYRYPEQKKYESFTIFSLQNKEELKKFLFLLYNGQLFLNGDTIIPKTENLYKGRLDNLKTITVRFYEKYKTFRENLFSHLVLNNPEIINRHQLLLYSQKIIDRLLFIRFAGETFLGTNVLHHFRNSITNLFFEPKFIYWTAITKLFDSFDKGYNHKIPKFNGELFKPDEIFNNLRVNNLILDEFVSILLSYDFKNDLKVEILGHIFEQSISDLEQLKIKHLKEIGSYSDYSSVENKRKNEGVFYTPEYITEYMVKDTIGSWLSERELEIRLKLKIDDITTIENDLERWSREANKLTRQEVINIHLEYWDEYAKVLSSIKILDPSCGSGAFLNQCFNYLDEEWFNVLKNLEKIKEKKPKVHKDNQTLLMDFDVGDITKENYNNEHWEIRKRIVTQNLFGVDLNSESVNITKLSLWLKTANKNVKLADLHDNIKQGNSLIEDKRFKFSFIWEVEFSEILNNSKFDIIIGNPPYINIENIIENEREYYLNNYTNCKGRTDIYIAFIERSLQLTNIKSYISFIIPYAFTNQNYGNDLRKYLVENVQINKITDLHNFFVFEQANVKNIVLNIKKQFENKPVIIEVAQNETDFVNKNIVSFETSQKDFLRLKECRFETKPFFNLLSLKDKIEENSITFETIFFVAYGARLNKKDSNDGKNIYIFDKESKGYKPFLEGKDIERYYFAQDGWLNYKPEEHYNSMFKELFENEKIMLINVVKDRCRFAYDNQKFYNSHTIINCVRYDKLKNATHISAKNALKIADLEFCSQFDCKTILAILNSNLINWYFTNFLSEGLHFYPNDVKALPIAKNSINNTILARLADVMINLTGELQKLKNIFFTVLQNDFQNINLTKKIQEYDKITFTEFEVELKKQKINLGLFSKKFEQQYFENKLKINEILESINKTDIEINNLVYKLYELTEEEIKIIEQVI